MKIETKKDWFFALLIFGPAAGITLYAIKDNSAILGSILFWTYSFLAWNYTYYTIDNGLLTARFIFLKRTVPIHEIEQLTKRAFGNRIFGLSKDIIEIKYGGGKTLNISPEDRDGVISLLLKIKEKTDLTLIKQSD